MNQFIRRCSAEKFLKSEHFCRFAPIFCKGRYYDLSPFSGSYYNHTYCPIIPYNFSMASSFCMRSFAYGRQVFEDYFEKRKFHFRWLEMVKNTQNSTKKGKIWWRFHILDFIFQMKGCIPLYCFKIATRMQEEVWLIKNSRFRSGKVIQNVPFLPKNVQNRRNFQNSGFIFQINGCVPLYCFETTTEMQGEVCLI